MSAPQIAPVDPAAALGTRWRISLRRLLLLTFAAAVALAYTGRQPLAWLAPQVLGVVLLCMAATEQMLAIGRAIKNGEAPAEARPALVAAIAARALLIATIAAYWITRYPHRQRVPFWNLFEGGDFSLLEQLWSVLYYLCIYLVIQSLLPPRSAKPASPWRALMDAVAWPIVIAGCLIVWSDQFVIPVLVGYAVDGVELAQSARFFLPRQGLPSFYIVAAALALAGANSLLCRKLLRGSGNHQRMLLAAWLITWVVALGLLIAIAKGAAGFLPRSILSALFLWPAHIWLLAAALVAVTCTYVALRWVPPIRSYEIHSAATFPLLAALAYAAGLLIELWLSADLEWMNFYLESWIYVLTMPQGAIMAAALLLALQGAVRHLRSRSQPSALVIDAYPPARIAAGALLVLAALAILIPAITAFVGCAVWNANV